MIDDEKKTRFLKVGFTPTEYKKIADFANVDLAENSRLIGRRLARYVHDTALDQVPITIDPIAQKQWIALSKLSSNLNQIAYVQNTTKYIDVDAAVALVGAIRNQLIGIGANGGEDEVEY